MEIGIFLHQSQLILVCTIFITMYQQQVNQIIQVISQPRIYNDARDQILGNFNKIQAFWGTGKAYYARDAPPLDLTESLPTQKFKAIGYAQRKTEEPSKIDVSQSFGVLLKANVSENDIPQFQQNLRCLFPGVNCNAKVEACKRLPDNKCLLTVSIIDAVTNNKYPASEVLTHLCQPQRYQQLNQALSNNLVQLIPLQGISEKDVEDYLNRVPEGIDAKLWEQAKQNNPDPKKFIPIPLIGFQALNERFKMQQFESQQQRGRLRQLSDQVCEIHKQVAAMKSKIEEFRRKKIVLGNRVLKVMIMQEIENRRGLPIQADEEKLRARMENIISELHAQTKYKGCLNELMSQLKQTQNQQHRAPHVSLDETVVESIKHHLKNELFGIEHLIKIIKQDNEILERVNNNIPPVYPAQTN